MEPHRSPSSIAALLAVVATAVTVLATLPACQSATKAAADGIGFEPVTSGLRRPVHLGAPSGDPRLFVLEQVGRVRIIKEGQLLDRPFLDLTAQVRVGFELGLLSIAFHPDYANNGWCYVNYTDRAGDTQVVRYSASGDQDVADPRSAKLIITIEQPYGNHNGGHSLFGPDGMLYIGTGDGGAANDPHGFGQDMRSLLGKMLRIDVDSGNPYAIPPDNPFVEHDGVPSEIWASGLRNPWRFHFDALDSLLYIADVGQNKWEEVNVTPAVAAGLNFGWNVREGAHCFKNPGCSAEDLTDPVLEYRQPDGCSVTGGLVYRGRKIPDLVGHYVYGDYCEGWIRSFRHVDGRATERRDWPAPRGLRITSFGADAAGELYVMGEDGRVFRFTAAD